MKIHINLSVALTLCILLATWTRARCEADSGASKRAGAPTIAITGLDVSDKTLKLTYEIRNESEQDVWILVGFGKTGMSAEAFMDKDDRTILIRRRLDVAFGGGGEIAYGRYVLLRSGQTLTDLITMAIPIYPQYGFTDEPSRQARGLEYATRLTIEIGYYSGDMPEMIRSVLEEADKIGRKRRSRDDEKILFYFRGSLYFNKLSEALLRQRDEEVLLPYTYQWFKGEKVLRNTVDDLHIPYEEKEDRLIRQYSLDIPPCTRVEIQYQTSMLEYFFPYKGQQKLLSTPEKQYLQSRKAIVVEDQKALKAFVNEINKGVPTGGIVRERSMAQVVCYSNDERLTSFPIYNDDSVVTDGRNRFTYDKGFRGLRKLTLEVKPFELRVQCAANLRNLWYRLRLYSKTERTNPVGSSSKSEVVYPAPTEWCDATVTPYKSIIIDEGIGIGEIDIMKTYMCPSASEGKCHYTMNSHCKPNSPPDMVLLFETKASWNQNGGPELFTFDNHDPKGGCVLFNDGTVKFIRTKEELQQLRWK
jgi:hypothetical protein